MTSEGASLIALTRRITAAMNLLNLVQNLIIVSELRVMRSFINSLVSVRWVTRWMYDSCTANCGSQVGCKLLRVLCHILGSSKFESL